MISTGECRLAWSCDLAGENDLQLKCDLYFVRDKNDDSYHSSAASNYINTTVFKRRP